MSTLLADSPARVSSRFEVFPGTSRLARGLLGAIAAWLLVPPVAFGVIEYRRMALLRRAGIHQSKIQGLYTFTYRFEPILPKPRAPGGRLLTPSERRKDLYHAALYTKYARAADHPWLPVWFDPPEPD